MLPYLLCSLAVLAVFSSTLQSQRPVQPRPEAVQLTVRPQVGDTLWLQLEQTIDTRSMPGSAEGSSGYGPVREQAQTQSINLRMFAHSLVEANLLHFTSLSATTDSLLIRSGPVGQLGASRPMTVAPADRTVHVNVTPAGAMSVVDPQPGTMALDASLQAMPAMLPARPVSVGEQWECDIALPSASVFGLRAEGLVHAEFRLDSITRTGRLAYVSMKGTLKREGAPRKLAPGTQLVTAGTLHGFLVLDRTRGWITEAETIIQVQSEVTSLTGGKSPARLLDVRLNQRLKVR